MDRVKRRLLLVSAALSPGVVTITLQEFAFSLAFMLLGLFGALSIAAATIAVFPQIGPSSLTSNTPKKTYPSLLVSSACASLRTMAPDPLVIRATLKTLISPMHRAPCFVTDEDQIAMVLAQIIARWDATDLSQLNDDQVRELWLVERLMRASPAEAGALAHFFASPTAMLAMRDVLAASVPV